MKQPRLPPRLAPDALELAGGGDGSEGSSKIMIFYEGPRHLPNGLESDDLAEHCLAPMAA